MIRAAGLIDQFDINLPSTSRAASVDPHDDVSEEAIRERWYYWHCMLGHLPEEILKQLTVNTVGVQLKVPERSTFDDCKVCQQFPPINIEEVTSKRVYDRPLKLLHLHVSKPFAQGPFEKRPFVIIIADDHTSYCEANFCFNETDMLTHLDKFIQNATHYFAEKVESVLLEGFTFEFYKLVINWLRSKKICVSTTIKHTRRTNPKAARLLNILVRTTRALYYDCIYQSFYWKECLEAANHLFNITTLVHGVTPFEHWYGRRPLLEKIKPFGSYVYNKSQVGGPRTRYVYMRLERNFHKVWDPSSKSAMYFLNVMPEDDEQMEQLLQLREEEHEVRESWGDNYCEQVLEKRHQYVITPYNESTQLQGESVENIPSENREMVFDQPRVSCIVENRFRFGLD